MGYLLAVTRIIDAVLGLVARTGAVAGLLLVLVVVFDVITRKMGINKEALFGFNSTQFQESEYWLHTFLFAMVIGYAYTQQAHVRIDLFRGHLRAHAKYIIELLGCLLFLIPFCAIMIYYNTRYVIASYYEGEVSASVIGLTNIWLHKAMLPVMFALLLLAAVSQAIKALAGLTGKLPGQMAAGVLGED
jgi:TRAP-type mannitol/chloroaromatic compound transport system permease small subunit